MKVGILTFHRADNFGAVLQCYALQEVLNKYGYDVRVIDYRCKSIEYSYKVFNKHILKPRKLILLFKLLKKRKVFCKFRKEYLRIDTSAISSYDIVLFGSDQIWNPIITNNDCLFLGADILPKKIAFAASDGGKIVLDSYVCNLLNRFTYISCREKSLSEKLLAHNIQVPIENICDPVFFISKNQWLNFAKMPNEDNYIIAFKVANHPDFDKKVVELGRKLGKNVIRICITRPIESLYDKSQKYIDCISPQEFVGYVAKADFVITTSFHVTAFSLILNKPFYVLSFQERNERIIDLLCNLNCIDRFVSNIPSIINSSTVNLDDYILNNEKVLSDVLSNFIR